MRREKPLHDVNYEYDSLRQELLQGKRYVFERPLLIVAVFAVAVKFTPEGVNHFMVPLAFVVLLFNLWFTVNRIKSMARIIAYQQLVLEGKWKSHWCGWETFLSLERQWRRRPHNREQLTAGYSERNYPSDAMGFYPPVFKFHISILAAIVIWQAVVLILRINDAVETNSIYSLGWESVSAFVTLILAVWTFPTVRKCTPNRIKQLVISRWAICEETFLWATGPSFDADTDPAPQSGT